MNEPVKSILDPAAQRLQEWGKLTLGGVIALVLILYMWFSHQTMDKFMDKFADAISEQTTAIKEGSGALKELLQLERLKAADRKQP